MRDGAPVGQGRSIAPRSGSPSRDPETARNKERHRGPRGARRVALHSWDFGHQELHIVVGEEKPCADEATGLAALRDQILATRR